MAIALLLLAACQEGGVDQGVETPAAPQTEPPSTSSVQATPTLPAEPTVLSGSVYTNPILQADFPDPHVIRVDGKYYAYATNAEFRNVQVAVSEDLVTWEVLPDAMPVLPEWAAFRSGLTWAPEVIQIGDQFHLFFTSRDRKSNRQCIGVATSQQPDAKFKDTNDSPLVCQAEEGGSIDASPFSDGDQLYLYWKNDGNCCGMPTYIYVQEMAADGKSLMGEPFRLISNDQPWEGGIIEAPTMVENQGSYYLFFSANGYGGTEYAVGYATCETPLGPCEDAPENPILKSQPSVIGPGHQAVLQVGQQTWIFYHAWETLANGGQGSRRFLWLDRLDWVDGRPVVRGPTKDSQPAPKLK